MKNIDDYCTSRSAIIVCLIWHVLANFVLQALERCLEMLSIHVQLKEMNFSFTSLSSVGIGMPRCYTFSVCFWHARIDPMLSNWKKWFMCLEFFPFFPIFDFSMAQHERKTVLIAYQLSGSVKIVCLCHLTCSLLVPFVHQEGTYWKWQHLKCTQ